MALRAHLRPWSGTALRHIAAGAQYDVLDFRYAGRGADNRWNAPDQPTLYLAGDEGVVIAEWGRHFAVNRTPALQLQTVERTIYRVRLTFEAVLDLRQQVVWADLSLTAAPQCFLNMTLARAVAQFVRSTTEAQALLVPSVCFLDQLDRWCLVVFLDRFAHPSDFITAVETVGPLRRG